MSIRNEITQMKETAPLLASSKEEIRNEALRRIIETLKSRKEEIFEANRKDREAARRDHIAPAVMKRLLFDEEKLESLVSGLEQLIRLPDPVGHITLARELDAHLKLYRVTCPIGVIGIIFEARPDALVQISALCIKSANCAILKGGKETKETNRILFSLIHEAAVSAGLPEKAWLQAEQHSEIDELLQCDGLVDLLIPRGSNEFVRYIMDHTKIPVMGHAEGICHIYADKACDKEKAIPVIIDAKTQYPAACNAVETLLVHRDIAGEFLPPLAAALAEKKVTLKGTEEVARIIPVEVISDDDFHKEYTDLILAVKLVGSTEEAVRHINRYGSHHTDSILTEDDTAAQTFMALVDSAGVYRNASTRFADGFRYGFGAEVGISTSKLHARGPVGLEGLMSYKYKLFGDGHTAGDYAEGKKSFHFKDIPPEE